METLGVTWSQATQATNFFDGHCSRPSTLNPLTMARGPKKHLKRLNAPKHWMLDKMGGMWAPCPSTGPHKMRECLPIILCLQQPAQVRPDGQGGVHDLHGAPRPGRWAHARSTRISRAASWTCWSSRHRTTSSACSTTPRGASCSTA